jgi:hypothetical protein
MGPYDYAPGRRPGQHVRTTDHDPSRYGRPDRGGMLVSGGRTEIVALLIKLL